MRFAETAGCAVIVSLLAAPPCLSADGLTPLHRVRYSMGTMFDIVVYHGSRADAERAVDQAMEEIARLDRVLSNFKAESDLSRLNREGHRGFVVVDPSLHDVIRASLSFSHATGGRFDVTIAPVLRAWKEARAEGREPSSAALAAAARCVGADKVETSAPDRVRYRQACVEIDLGGIGKGYAVDRALDILKRAGIRDALVNAGGSSIAAAGAPPGRTGWPVRVGSDDAGGKTIELRDETMSTSQQNFVPLAFSSTHYGDIIDPRHGRPAANGLAVSVVAPNATLSDALSTSLLMLTVDEARPLLVRYPGVSAHWMSSAGEHAHLP